MLWFIFLCQRLFKGKVSDNVVRYHRFFFLSFFLCFLLLKLFRVDTTKSYSDRVVETLLVYSHVQKRLQNCDRAERFLI